MTETDQEIKDTLGKLPVVFGLRQQGHVPTIRQMLLDGHSWKDIGTAIGWMPETAERHFGMVAYQEWVDLESKVKRLIGEAQNAAQFIERLKLARCMNQVQIDRADQLLHTIRDAILAITAAMQTK